MEEGINETIQHTMTIEPSAIHTHTVIFLHGRGSNALEFRDDFFESENKAGLRLPQVFPSVRWVLPTAPLKYSVTFKEETSEWFDMGNCQDTETTTTSERGALADSIRQIWRIVDEESKHVPAENIYLGGISQGCAVAVLALLMAHVRLAGFIGVAGCMPYAARLTNLPVSMSDRAHIQFLDSLTSFMQLGDVNKDNTDCSTTANCIAEASRKQSMSIFLCHGTDDHVVDVAHGRVMRDSLQHLGYHVTWQENDKCGHWIKEPEQVDAIVSFLSRKVHSET